MSVLGLGEQSYCSCNGNIHREAKRRDFEVVCVGFGQGIFYKHFANESYLERVFTLFWAVWEFPLVCSHIQRVF